MSKKTRNYFKTKKTYSGDQNHFMDSIGYITDTNDTAAESVQGFAKKATDANAILRTDDIGDGFTRFISPHQVPEFLLTPGASHATGTPEEVGALKLTPLNYDSGKREDWKLEVQVGKPTSIASATDIDCIKIDDADDNGLYLKSSTEFEETSSALALKDGGIVVEKLEELTTHDRVLVSGASGLMEEAITTKDQVNSISTVGNSKVVVTSVAGLLEAGVPTLTQIGYTIATPGTATASKAVVLGATKKIDVMDITSLKLNGTTLSSTATELNQLDGVVAGTLSANKAVIVDASSQIDNWDVLTAFKLNGTQVTSTAAEINKLDGVTVSTSDLNVLLGVAAGGVTAADLIAVDGAGSGSMKPSVLKSVMNKKLLSFTFSFEAGYIGLYKIRIPWDCTLRYFNCSVEKAIGGADDGQVQFQDNGLNLMTGAYLVAGKLPIAQSAINGTAFFSNLLTNNTFSNGDFINITTKKTTAIGTIAATLEFELDD